MHLGEHHRLLISAAAAIAVRNEQLQIKIARGESDIDLEQLTRLSNTLSRLFAQLGLDRSRAPKAALPSRLGTYLERRRLA
jgi:ribosome maturation factor RimP